MALFDTSNIKLDVLKKRAFNYRWAEVPDGVIPLTAADPDYPVAPEIQEAMMDYVKDGYFSYTPKLGYPEFRDSISKALMERKGEEIDPNLILPIDSAARGMYVIAQTVLRQGDEMIVFDPVDYLFRESCLAAGGKVVLFPAKLKDGYIDLSELESYITPKTRMIGLCNPHNPYGVVYRPEDLEHIMSLCEKYNLYIMNDEIWSDIVFPEEPFRSIYSLGSKRCRRVMSVFGFSKSFGIAGLRAGCVYTTDEKLFEQIVENSDVMSTAGGIASISQIAGTACMSKCYYWVDAFLEHLKKNRDYAVDRLNQMPMINAYRPHATYLLYVDIRAFGMKSEEFTDYMKEKVKLAVVSGGEKFFGSGSEGYIRICFATSHEILEEGLNRLEKGIDMLIREKEMDAVSGNYYPGTDDGSYGHAGMVTTMVEELVEKGNKYDVCIAIGPMIMMKFVCLLTKKLEIPTVVSMNPIMVDGTGMCGACRLHVGDEIKFACVDGPEFDGHLVNFDEAMKRQQMYKTQEGRAMLKLQEGDTHHGGCGQCGGDE